MASLDRYRLLGNSGLRVSPLSLGTMTFGTEWGWGTEKDEARRIFDAYVEAGGNFIDTANYYTGGTSESFVGEFAEERRDALVIATKYSLNMRPGDPNAGGNHRKSLVQSLEASLTRLRTDYVDLLWIHSWDSITPIEEIMRALDDVVRAGKVLYIGVSNAPAWTTARANTLAAFHGWAPFIGVQVQYSLIERSVERDIVPMARALGIGVVPWSPLGGGVLTGKYARLDEGSKDELDQSLRAESNKRRANERNNAIIAVVSSVAEELGVSTAQVAIRWAMDRGVSSVVIGARTLAQLENNLGAAGVELSYEQRERLDEASAIELGYPHDYLRSRSVQRYLFGGTEIERS